MAATRLIALHVCKGKTVVQCLADRTDYSQNEEKTNGGEYISSYECDPQTADDEFMLSKRQYEHITGRQQVIRNSELSGTWFVIPFVPFSYKNKFPITFCLFLIFPNDDI